ncbi:MAG: PilX N-terminal domain-containing pilus assembly protein [Pseudomonadota bacterium]
MRRQILNPSGSQQQGAALIMTLIFLVLLTMIGVTSVRVSTLEERMAGNTSDRYRAFQAAEAALRDCESVLQQASLPAFNNTNGYYQPAAVGATPRWKSINWSSSTASREYSGTFSGVGSKPRCIIEEMPAMQMATSGGSLKAGTPQPELGVYRITARGTGVTGDTVVMLQTMYIR